MRSGETFRSSHAPAGRRSAVARADLERRDLEVDAGAHRQRLREPGVGADAVAEAGERLIAHDRVGPHVDDRLEHRPEGRVGDDRVDPLAHVPDPAPFADHPPDQDAGQVGELDERRDVVRQGRLLERAGAVDGEHTDDAAVVADRGVRGEMRPEAAALAVVRVPGIRRGLDPGALLRPRPEAPPALRRQGSQLGIGAPGDDPAQRRRAAVELEHEQPGGDDPAQAGHLAADRLRRHLGSVVGADRPDGVGDQGTLASQLG